MNKCLKYAMIGIIGTMISCVVLSCKKDLKTTEVMLTCIIPDNLPEAKLSKVVLSAKNITTGKSTEYSLAQNASGIYTFTLFEGLYNFSLEAQVSYTSSGVTHTGTLKGYKESLNITGIQTSVTLDLFISKKTEDFVIAEIFFAGTLTPEGKQYVGDTYFRIYNNSDEVLYADGLVIAETKFLTTTKRDYMPNIMSTDVAVNAIYRIPGNGTDYPVQPGKSILICDNAINHRNANVNSFDLRTADFEWYDESTNPAVADIDNPSVTNLDKIYCYTLTVWVPHNRGFNSYVLGRLGTDKETYLRDYTYFYNYNLVTNSGTFPMTGDCYRFPNDWVIDAVNLSVESEFQWILTDPGLDMGWTYCGTINSDKTRYGKSVRRKVESITIDGRRKLKDSNNSKVDFDAEQTANPFYFD